MKQGTNSRRPRARSNNGKRPSNRNSNYDSGGSDGRIRGNASQVHEKYLTLAREALSFDDSISSENYFQHAEHFYRVMMASADIQSQKESQKTTKNLDQNSDQSDVKDNSGDGGQNERGRSRRNRNNNRSKVRDDRPNTSNSGNVIAAQEIPQDQIVQIHQKDEAEKTIAEGTEANNSRSDPQEPISV